MFTFKDKTLRKIPAQRGLFVTGRGKWPVRVSEAELLIESVAKEPSSVDTLAMRLKGRITEDIPELCGCTGILKLAHGQDYEIRFLPHGFFESEPHTMTAWRKMPS